MQTVTEPQTQRAPPGFWRRLVRSPSGLVGLSIVLLLVFCAAFADVLAPYSPTKMGAGGRFLPPGGKYLLGTDEFGRDMFSRILYGSRITLLIGAVAVGISLTVGMLVGMIAAFRRGWIEAILMRGTDVLFSFTETLIALSFVAVLGPSLQNAVIAVGVAGVPFYARTCYSAALVETSKPYFEASIAAGAGPARLVLTHLLPNVLPTMIVVATLGVSTAILAAAGLSFLGLGAQPPTSEWGYMLAGSRDYINRAPWLMTIPGLAIAVTVLGFNLLGDGLRTSLDPVERK
ncbi:ABC transporter permease [uncultured Roseibium sp.]|uniref:ABC transporter permease n=1 Tax=uncultured Roseibium sp. TaxID=1936171 RepID=UPI00260D7134|nr:ABC transporter permease [uncultured Roseibium sp.]